MSKHKNIQKTLNTVKERNYEYVLMSGWGLMKGECLQIAM